jgi:hypothetical protein
MKKIIVTPSKQPEISTEHADREIAKCLPIRVNCFECEKAFRVKTLSDVYRMDDLASLWATCPHCGWSTCVEYIGNKALLRASSLRRRTSWWGAFVRPFTWRFTKVETIYEDH